MMSGALVSQPHHTVQRIIFALIIVVCAGAIHKENGV